MYLSCISETLDTTGSKFDQLLKQAVDQSLR